MSEPETSIFIDENKIAEALVTKFIDAIDGSVFEITIDGLTKPIIVRYTKPVK